LKYLKVTALNGAEVVVMPEEIEAIHVHEQYQISATGLTKPEGGARRTVWLEGKEHMNRGRLWIQESLEEFEALLSAAHEGTTN
jgi:hypothetical protein